MHQVLIKQVRADEIEDDDPYNRLLNLLEGKNASFLLGGYEFSLVEDELTLRDDTPCLTSIREIGMDFTVIAEEFAENALNVLCLEYLPDLVIETILTLFCQFNQTYPREVLQYTIFHLMEGELILVVEFPKKIDLGYVLMKVSKVKLRVLH